MTISAKRCSNSAENCIFVWLFCEICALSPLTTKTLDDTENTDFTEVLSPVDFS